VRSLGIAAAACALAACNYDAKGDAAAIGTITRGTETVSFVGYDPRLTNEVQTLGHDITAAGYAKSVDGTLLIEVDLVFAPNATNFTDNMLTSLAVNQQFSPGEFGIGIDLLEQLADQRNITSPEVLYRQEFDFGDGDTATGTFSVTDTDYESFIDGHLSATLSSDEGTRALELDIHWTSEL